jgi:phage shock protein PspC (stress-responsive transcriptional regulator)
VRRLRRSATDRFLGGVAGGIAATYGIDPIIVRVAFVVASMFGGSGIIAYLVLWAVLPVDDGSMALVSRRRYEPGHLIGFVLLTLGTIAIFDRVIPDRGRDAFDVFWPLALIGGGIAILVLRANTWSTSPGPVPPTPPTPPSSPPPPPAGDATDTTDATGATDGARDTDDAGDQDANRAAVGAADASHPAGATAPNETADRPTHSAWAPPAPWPMGPPTLPAPPLPPLPPRPRRARRYREPSLLAPLTISVLLVFVGSAALLSAVGAMSVDPAVVAAIALMIVGAALGVGAFVGRARGLIALGVVGTLVAGTLATIDVPLRGGIGERHYAPAATADVRGTYRLAIGDLNVDLSNVPFTTASKLDVDVRVGIGQATVVVPRGVTVEVVAHSGAGVVRLFGREENGVDADDSGTFAALREGAPVVHIDARSGLGAVDVHRTGENLR